MLYLYNIKNIKSLILKLDYNYLDYNYNEIKVYINIIVKLLS